MFSKLKNIQSNIYKKMPLSQDGNLNNSALFARDHAVAKLKAWINSIIHLYGKHFGCFIIIIVIECSLTRVEIDKFFYHNLR